MNLSLLSKVLPAAVRKAPALPRRRVAALIFPVLIAGIPIGHSKEPSFQHDVLPVLSKLGCNTGGCHGALAGKGGFRLSLFAYDPERDHYTITREVRGRRIETGEPGRSLLLTKPTTALRHKGGKRLEAGSPNYRILADWIASGAPGPREDDARLESLRVNPGTSLLKLGETKQLTVEAAYSDGGKRDVTRWAKFTSNDKTVADVDPKGHVTVVGHGQGSVTVWFSSRIVTARITSPYPYPVPESVYSEAPRAGFIDDLVLQQLQRLNLRPSPPADDATFVRRAFVDTIGKLPTPAETHAFLAEADSNKHARLIDQLLSRPEFIDYWTYKWSDILLITGSKLRPEAVRTYYEWLRSSVTENKPWDTLARELVTAKGSSLENGASNFFAVHQEPESMAENVSKAFLSLSINCAKCHNHPLEKWTNDQYYAFANLFARVRAKGWGGDARSGDGKRVLYVEPQGDLIQPRTGKAQPPAPLDAPAIDVNDSSDRREVLADWITSPENPYFARAIVNRVWANFMGIGLVDPVDDLRVSNPPSNEKLLAALARKLVDDRYNLKTLMRAVLNSHAYRRDSRPLPENRADTRHYARFYPRRLMAEVLNDAITDVTGIGDTFNEIALNDGSSEKTDFYGEGTRALQLYDSAVKSYFLNTFGRNQREITCECERSNQPSMIQVLHLSNGATINLKLASERSRVTEMTSGGRDDATLVEEAYLLCLARPPSGDESRQFQSILARAPEAERRETIEDLFWSLLTSREFLFQH